MNLHTKPELIDKLAAGYALGTLRAGARRRFERIAREHVTVRAAAILWQERLAAMTELESEVAPSPNLWKRIENLLAAERQAVKNAASVAQRQSLLDKIRASLMLWRGAALAGALGAAAAVTVGLNATQHRDAELRVQRAEVTQLAAQLKAAPEIQYVSVLADNKAAATVLVTFDPKHQRLTLKRVSDFRENADRSLQLWALPKGGKPQSLGVMSSDNVARLVTTDAAIKEVPVLAISLEPKGGVPSAGGPTGPVLFTGALLQTEI